MKYTINKITRVNPKPFKGDDGSEIYYAWITAETSDGLTLEFGTKRDDYTLEDSGIEVELQKTEKFKKNAEGQQVPDGFRYKEII